MKPTLQYGITGRLIRQGDARSHTANPCVNEGEERIARIREGISMRDGLGRETIPAMFGSYGNGPFLMPTLHMPR
jgi:hypothetical protein